MTSGLRVAVLGTRGIPANYSGFETCAEEVALGLKRRGHEVTVYCRHGNAGDDPQQYQGVSLRYTPHIDNKVLGTITHTFTATIDALRRQFDVLLYFNSANAIPALVAKVLGRAPVVINVDGLDWQRRKWGRIGRSYYQFAEWLSTKVADRVIADSMVIQGYYQRRWRTPTSFVAYGAHLQGSQHPEILEHYGLEPDSYFFVGSRLEPENNADLTVQAFQEVDTTKLLVIAGGANYDSDFIRQIRQTTDPRVRFLGPVYEQGHMRELHCGAFAYVHGNEVGGTNPALLKALGYGNCVLSLNVSYNAEVLSGAGLLYERDVGDLAEKMKLVLNDDELVATLRRRARERIEEAYQWEFVVEGYDRILSRAVKGDYRAKPSSDIAYRPVAAGDSPPT